MPKSLADGKIKFTLLTEEPADPESPTDDELNAGIDASCNVLFSDFTWSAADSEKVNDRALCDDVNANVPGASNYTGGVTVFRYFDETTKNADAVEDVVYAALKVKGTRIWGYARETAKPSSAPWVAADEIYLGMEVVTDTPQRPGEGTGYIKRRIMLEPQRGWPEIVVAAGP